MTKKRVNMYCKPHICGFRSDDGVWLGEQVPYTDLEQASLCRLCSEFCKDERTDAWPVLPNRRMHGHFASAHTGLSITQPTLAVPSSEFYVHTTPIFVKKEGCFGFTIFYHVMNIQKNTFDIRKEKPNKAGELL